MPVFLLCGREVRACKPETTMSEQNTQSPPKRQPPPPGQAPYPQIGASLPAVLRAIANQSRGQESGQPYPYEGHPTHYTNPTYVQEPWRPPYIIQGPRFYREGIQTGAHAPLSMLNGMLTIIDQDRRLRGDTREKTLKVIAELVRQIEYYHDDSPDKRGRNAAGHFRARRITASLNIRVCDPPLSRDVYNRIHGQPFCHLRRYKTTTAADALEIPIRRLGAIIQYNSMERARRPQYGQGDLLKAEGKRARTWNAIRNGLTGKQIADQYPGDFPNGYDPTARKYYARQRAAMATAKQSHRDTKRARVWEAIRNGLTGKQIADQYPGDFPNGYDTAAKKYISRHRARLKHAAAAPLPPPRAPDPRQSHPEPKPAPAHQPAQEMPPGGETIPAWFLDRWTAASGGAIPPKEQTE